MIPTLIFSALLFSCGDIDLDQDVTTGGALDVLDAVEAIEALEGENDNQMIAIKELRFEAIFDGKNLTVKNPYSSTGVGWCVKSITINEDKGLLFPIKEESEVYEFDLSTLGIEEGATYTVLVMHEEGCLPEIITD